MFRIFIGRVKDVSLAVVLNGYFLARPLCSTKIATVAAEANAQFRLVVSELFVKS